MREWKVTVEKLVRCRATVVVKAASDMDAVDAVCLRDEEGLVMWDEPDDGTIEVVSVETA